MRGWGASSKGQSRFLHLEPGSRKRLLLVGDEPWLYVGHWWQGAMRPCGGEGCRLCELGCGRQVRMALEVALLPGGELRCWEFGPGVAERIRAALGWAERVGGLAVEVWRQGGARGQVMVEHTAEAEAEGAVLLGSSAGGLEGLRKELDAEVVLRAWWDANGWL